MIAKIKNQKSKIKNNEAGFTLVEMLASIVVLVAVGAVIAGITTSSLRGTNKTAALDNIRQNGNYALNQMSKTIQYAQTFNGLSKKNDSFGNPVYERSCFDSAVPTPTPAEYQYIKVTALDKKEIVYYCKDSTLTADDNSLVNDDSVSLTNCKIACIQVRSTDMPIIKISFELESKNANGLVENSTPPILFQTSVAPRNH